MLLLQIFLCVSVCVCAELTYVQNVHACGLRGQKLVLDCLEVEMQIVVRLEVWVLVTETGSLQAKNMPLPAKVSKSSSGR